MRVWEPQRKGEGPPSSNPLLHVPSNVRSIKYTLSSFLSSLGLLKQSTAGLNSKH